MIDIKDVLTLSDGNQYGVVSKAIKDNKTYYYLMDINDNSNIKFCFEDRVGDRIDLIEVSDEKLIKKLLLYFSKNVRDNY